MNYPPFPTFNDGWDTLNPRDIGLKKNDIGPRLVGLMMLPTHTFREVVLRQQIVVIVGISYLTHTVSTRSLLPCHSLTKPVTQ